MATPSTYIAITRRSLDLEDYIDLARRHMTWIIAPTLAGLVIAIVVAFMLPNQYVSQAVLRITPSQISANIVATTLNQQLTERIMAMEQEILSRTSLSSIIQDPKLDLYKSDRASKPLEDVIETMRTRDIHIGILEVPGSALDRRATAFNISFTYKDAHKAQQVVQTLITRFTEANLTSQRDQQNMVTSFVHDELAGAKADLTGLDDELTKFRIENSGKLPEESSLNIAQMTSLQQQLATVNDSLNRLAQQKVQLDTHLETLQSQKELLGMFDKETDINAPLARQNERLLMLNKQVQDMEAALAQMRLVYKPGYPDIRDNENRLREIRKERDTLQAQQAAEEAKPKEAAPKKTSFQQAQSAANIQAQIDATLAQIKGYEMERQNRMKDQDELSKSMAAYQKRLETTSTIQAKYADLVRNQRAATEKLMGLQNKEQLAEQNGELLQRKAGETLDVLDAPSLPTQPSKPDRWMVVGAGFAISLLVGIALAGVQEARDTSLKNLKDVRAYTNLPVLTSVPLLENTILVRRKRRLAYLAWSAGIILGMIAVTAALYYHFVVVVV